MVIRKRILDKSFLPKLHVDLERWRYNMRIDAYISTLGRIRGRDGTILNTCAVKNYLYFRGAPVHRLVMETWHPVPGWHNLTIDHKDHNTRNNRVSNLEWVTEAVNKQRDKKDTEENSPEKLGGKLEDPAPKIEITNNNIVILLNGIKIPYDDAKMILSNNKGLKMCKGKVEEAFKKVMETDAPIEFGGNVIQKVSA